MVSSAVLQTRAPDDQNTRKSDVKWYVGKLQGQLNEMQAAMGILNKVGKPITEYTGAAQRVMQAVGLQDAYRQKLNDYATDKTIITVLQIPMTKITLVHVSFLSLISSDVNRIKFSLKPTRNCIPGML